MCGILGLSGKGVKSDVEHSLNLISHRGPDDFGIFMDSTRNVALAHVRLSILDLSPLGHQPMVSDCGNVVLIFNGEIYNFLDLRSELEPKGVCFKGNSDTEVLLELYLDQGESMLKRLNGIFAFAIWDARCGSMLIARDALGVKPLYYSADNGLFCFSSEIKALIPLMEGPTTADLLALHRYLTFLWCPGEQTPINEVKKLGPGEGLWVKDGIIDRRFTWYSLPHFRPRLPDLNRTDAINGTVHYLRQAVQRQMIADVPVGAFLSGGLDSSSIVAFAKEIEPKIRCFTIDSIDTESGMPSDLPYAKQVAAYLGVDLEIVKADARGMADGLIKMVHQLDEPLADPASLNVLYISQIARDQGIKVLLSGAGGDDIFTGYRRHRAESTHYLWRLFPKSMFLNALSVLKTFYPSGAMTRRLAKLSTGLELNQDSRLVNYFVWTQHEDLVKLYSTDFRAQLGEQSAEQVMLDFLSEIPRSEASLERLLALEQRFFLADHNLTYTDKMSMAAGVEVRVPFLDLDLVEFAHRIPCGLKQKGREGKWIMKKAMESFLPKKVIYRAKSGFGAPLRRWMRFELRDLLGDLLSEKSLRDRGFFDPAAVQKLLADNDNGRVDAAYTLLSLLCIEIWFRNLSSQKNLKHTPMNFL